MLAVNSKKLITYYTKLVGIRLEQLEGTSTTLFADGQLHLLLSCIFFKLNNLES